VYLYTYIYVNIETEHKASAKCIASLWCAMWRLSSFLPFERLSHLGTFVFPIMRHQQSRVISHRGGVRRAAAETLFCRIHTFTALLYVRTMRFILWTPNVLPQHRLQRIPGGGEDLLFSPSTSCLLSKGPQTTDTLSAVGWSKTQTKRTEYRCVYLG
jgi:hypothetical protein